MRVEARYHKVMRDKHSTSVVEKNLVLDGASMCWLSEAVEERGIGQTMALTVAPPDFTRPTPTTRAILAGCILRLNEYYQDHGPRFFFSVSNSLKHLVICRNHGVLREFGERQKYLRKVNFAHGSDLVSR